MLTLCGINCEFIIFLCFSAEFEFKQLTQAGYPEPRCMDHLNAEDSYRPADARAAWQFRKWSYIS